MNKLFGPIKSRQEALKVIKDCTNGFFVLAGISAVFMVLMGNYYGLIDAALYGGLGYILRRTNNSVVAVIILIMSVFSVLVTGANALGFSNEGGTNIFLSLIVLWASIRATQASFKLS